MRSAGEIRQVDGRKFDDVTKALAASTPSRRRVLGGLMGGALASVFGASKVVAGPEVNVTEPICDDRAVICSATGEEPFVCGGRGNCFCAETISGSKRCVNAQGGITCLNRRRCDRNRDCAKGEFCINVSECEDCPRRRGVCFASCG